MNISSINNIYHQEKYSSTFLDQATQVTTGLNVFTDQQNEAIKDHRELYPRGGIIFSETC
ncbi:hypothetical protein HX13_12730 [Chryseobacterium sp. P1-3]|uniref:Uncharacterized protein n=1 Tax=Chryseobacterium gallinarum TaxID=1324352 RepID=A0A0G3M4U6_CHRGL|nr:hypothetical protein OK18_16035 [Chryseobacterium gallinarum]KFF74851.1 hypothetical protein HX13_12730 [Chryseobacterium sp. P1-3]